jgi:hypothetical protein
MKKQYGLFFIIAIVLGVSVVNGVLKWLGIPTYNELLEMIFGEPNGLNRVIAIAITGVFIYLIAVGMPKLKNK